MLGKSWLPRPYPWEQLLLERTLLLRVVPAAGRPSFIFKELLHGGKFSAWA